MFISYVDGTTTAQPKMVLRRGGGESALTRHSSALETMTDFARDSVVSVAPTKHIDDALQDMILAGIRSLLVMESDVVLGLITASDILGTRPIQFLQSHLCDSYPCRHKDVHVSDVMTPWIDLRVLEFWTVAAATVGDLVDEFDKTLDTHMLVIENSSTTENAVRGILSKSRLFRQLGPTRSIS